MTVNQEFLQVIRDSFATYLSVGTSRSTAKLKTLHGRIARDLQEALGAGFSVRSQGYGDDKEGNMQGRYYPKNVDVTISSGGKPVAGYAVKFVVRNYSQNSNNYFENMLGETANIRSNSMLYFQVFVIFEKVPYYEKGEKFKKYDVISEHNIDKYLLLSKDDPSAFFHIPDKTLFVLIRLKEKSPGHRFADSDDYARYYQSVMDDADLMAYSTKIKGGFGPGVIYNDYRHFIERSCRMILEKCT